MKKNLLISLTFLLLYISSKAQTAIPCSINYATTNRKALSGDLAGFNNANWSWQCPVNYNTGNQDPNNPLSTADNAIDSRLPNIIKNELGEIIYRNSGGMAQRFNLFYKGWGNSNPSMIATLFQVPYCGSGSSDLFGYGNAPFDPANPFNDLVSDRIWRANPTKRDLIYSSYLNYGISGYPESKDNMIFPIINIIKSTTNNRVVNYTINLDAHYKKLRGFTDCGNVVVNKSVRTQLFTNTAKLWTTTSMASIIPNGFSQEFYNIVKENVDGIITMLRNGIDVKYIELGNETGWDAEWFDLNGHNTYYNATTAANMYSNFINLPEVTKLGGLNTFYTDAIWSSSNRGKFFTSLANPTFVQLNADANTQATLSAFGGLCKMYISIIRYEISQIPSIAAKATTIKFGINTDDVYDTASKAKRAAYFNYLVNNKDAIGFVGFINHPYLNITPAMVYTKQNLNLFFNELRNKATSFIKTSYKTKNTAFYNRLTAANAEIWLTEWDARDGFNDISNTLLDAMYYFDVHIAMQDINTGVNMVAPFASKNNLCQLASYQLLFGSPDDNGNTTAGNATPGESILGLKYGVTTGNNGGISRQAVFYAHKILSPLFNIKPDYIANTNGGFNTPSGINNDTISFRTYIKEGVATGDSLVLRYCNKIGCFSNWHSCFTDKDIYVYFNNKSSRDYKINLSSVITGQTGRVIDVELNRIYANKLSASRGLTTFRSDATLYEAAAGNVVNADSTIQIQNGTKYSYYNTDGTTVNTAVQNFIISKYSLGYIKIRLRVYSTPQPNFCAVSQRIATPEIEDQNVSKKITDKQIIYPNPTTGLVNLNVQLSEPVDKYTIEVFSVDGRVVLSEIHNEKLDGNTYVNNSINISNQPNGVYFIRIISDKNVLLNNKVLLNK